MADLIFREAEETTVFKGGPGSGKPPGYGGGTSGGAGAKMGTTALNAAKVGTVIRDGNGRTYVKRNDDLPWHDTENKSNRYSSYALANSKEYGGVSKVGVGDKIKRKDLFGDEHEWTVTTVYDNGSFRMRRAVYNNGRRTGEEESTFDV